MKSPTTIKSVTIYESFHRKTFFLYSSFFKSLKVIRSLRFSVEKRPISDRQRAHSESLEKNRLRSPGYYRFNSLLPVDSKPS